MNKTTRFFQIAVMAAAMAFSAPAALPVLAQRPQPNQGMRPQQPGKGPDGKPFNPAEFRETVRAFITKEAGLSKKEADVVFPLFFDLKDLQRDLHKKIDRACTHAARERLTERECQRVLAEVQRLQRQAVDAENQFYDRLRARGITASKVLRIKAADEKFRRSTFHQVARGGQRR